MMVVDRDGVYDVLSNELMTFWFVFGEKPATEKWLFLNAWSLIDTGKCKGMM